MVICPVCKGAKEIRKTLWSDPGDTVPCTFCNGKGEVSEKANSSWVSTMFENFSDTDEGTKK
jgi:DnaJ-class molecular chaperone